MSHQESRKKSKRQQKQQETQSANLVIKEVYPLTERQQITFDQFDEGKHLLLHGMAGTGKTFIALYLALQDVLEEKVFHNVTIVRSVVPSREMGFLPGNPEEKSAVYEAPYEMMVNNLLHRGDGYVYAKQKNILKFITTSFIRGITIDNSIIIVDEMQNLSFAELDTILTRVGKNCKIIFCGDFRQTDFTRDSEKQGLKNFMSIIERMKGFAWVEFLEEDIVRSALVKDYIIAKSNMGY